MRNWREETAAMATLTMPILIREPAALAVRPATGIHRALAEAAAPPQVGAEKVRSVAQAVQTWVEDPADLGIQAAAAAAAEAGLVDSRRGSTAAAAAARQ